MNNKFDYTRKKYPLFIYHSFDISDDKDDLKIVYDFEIEGLSHFNPYLKIPKNIIKGKIDNKFLNNIVFNLGCVELISYVKATCSPNIEIRAGYLDDEQINFYKKLYFNGLGEFLYTNNIEIDQMNLFNIIINHEKEEPYFIDYSGSGNLIPVGGGKDSCVTLELLKSMNNTCFVINPKEANINCVNVSENPYIYIKRVLDKRLIELNSQGYLNGHTPFSAIVAFTSYLVSYLAGKKYIILSNEGSANEATVIGTNINHQYSKTYEFECDFNNYTKKYLCKNIYYFSFLRPLSELQIANIFSDLKKYHYVFRSCNVGSKKDNWVWCCNCAKCLFVYIVLSPFLSRDELISIFGCDLYEKEELLDTFIELLGYKDAKPFECVGTYIESRYAVSLVIKKYGDADLPYLLKYYKDHFNLEFTYVNTYNEENNLPHEFSDILKGVLKDYDR